jgi:uncharacterized membrane protein YeiB
MFLLRVMFHLFAIAVIHIFLFFHTDILLYIVCSAPIFTFSSAPDGAYMMLPPPMPK